MAAVILGKAIQIKSAMQISGIILVLIIKPGTWTITNIEDALGGNNKAPCISNAMDTILDLVK